MVAQDSARVSFHESTLTAVLSHGSSFQFDLAGVQAGDDERNAVVMVEGVDALFRNDLPTDGLRMEKLDGEVLTLRQEGDQVFLVVEWNDFAAKTQETVVYTLRGSRIALRTMLSV